MSKEGIFSNASDTLAPTPVCPAERGNASLASGNVTKLSPEIVLASVLIESILFTSSKGVAGLRLVLSITPT